MSCDVKSLNPNADDFFVGPPPADLRAVSAELDHLERDRFRVTVNFGGRIVVNPYGAPEWGYIITLTNPNGRNQLQISGGSLDQHDGTRTYGFVAGNQTKSLDLMLDRGAEDEFQNLLESHTLDVVSDSSLSFVIDGSLDPSIFPDGLYEPDIHVALLPQYGEPNYGPMLCS